MRRSNGLAWWGVKLKHLLLGDTQYLSKDRLFISFSRFIGDEDIKGLRPKQFRSDIRKSLRARRKIMQRFSHGQGMRRYLNYEMATYMQEILMRTDKASMASSLEVRVPYLMPELLEFLQTVPERQLVDYRSKMMYGTKMILKSLCEDVFGEEFTYRWKEGLSVPTKDLFGDNHCREYVESSLLPGIKKRELMDYEYVLKLWRRVKDDRKVQGSNIQALWCALSFELWAQMYLDGSPFNGASFNSNNCKN